jgi:opacity protein-like surface antigen
MNTNTSLKGSLKLKSAVAAIFALIGTGSALAADFGTPFVRAEANYTDTGYTGNYGHGYKFGPGITAGTIIANHHEFSISSSITNWTGATTSTPGIISTQTEIEQIPLLLNYRYHMPLDTKGQFTVFAGPTIGLIHEKMTYHNADLGTLLTVDPTLVGDSSDTAWKTAFGGTIGISIKLNSHWSVDATAQILKTSQSNYAFYTKRAGQDEDFTKATTRPSFTLSANYSW